MESRRKVTIENSQGLHARPCHALVTAALSFRSELRVSAGGRDVNGKSILELMTLNACSGTELEFVARGEDADSLVEELCRIVRSGFGEST